MRIIYQNYAATAYGRASLSVTDPEGKEIFHTDERPAELNNEKALFVYLKKYVKNKGKEELVEC